MSGSAKHSLAATASYNVRFPKRPKGSPIQLPERERPSRLTLQLAMAHKIDGMILRGEIRNMAEAAKLAGVTRARLTQIMNLMLLAPAIQAAISESGVRDPITERHLRAVATEPNWSCQGALLARSDNPRQMRLSVGTGRAREPRGAQTPRRRRTRIARRPTTKAITAFVAE